MDSELQLLKPDWNTAPNWANWVAMEYDGAWSWYQKKPRYDDGTWVVDDDRDEYPESVKFDLDDDVIKSTLKHRPIDFTNVEVDQKWTAKGNKYIIKSIEDDIVFCSDDFGFSWKGKLTDFVETFTLVS